MSSAYNHSARRSTHLCQVALALLHDVGQSRAGPVFREEFAECIRLWFGGLAATVSCELFQGEFDVAFQERYRCTR